MDTTPSFPALQPTYPPYPFPLVRGTKDRVFDDQGQEYFDFYGGHCVCSTGHSHPKVAAALAAQAQEFLFYSTAATIPVRDRAAKALVDFANSRFDVGTASVFFCNSGAEANENALKLSILLTGRKRLASFVGGWHGRTTLALSVTDDPKITTAYDGLLAPCDRLPWNDLAALEAFDFTQVAAVILEPIQSMSGIHGAPATFFQLLREKTRAAGTMLIFDEIQTGMGRLGHPFAASRYAVQPDFITSAKGIASGVPMGALLINKTIAPKIPSGALGSTFGGSPLACAALLATLEVIKEEGLMDNALRQETALRKGLDGTIVSEVRGEGMLLGLKVPGGGAPLKKHLLQKRILVGGSSDAEVLRLMPPLVLTDEAVAAIIHEIRAFSDTCTK